MNETNIPDRNEVISALERCATGAASCDGCTYKAKCKGTINAAMADAAKLLKEDEAGAKALLNITKAYFEFGDKIQSILKGANGDAL